MRELLADFSSYFCPSALDQVLRADSVFNRTQRPGENVRDYISVLRQLARKLSMLDEGIVKCIIMRGLHPHIKAFVLQHPEELTFWPQ